MGEAGWILNEIKTLLSQVTICYEMAPDSTDAADTLVYVPAVPRSWRAAATLAPRSCRTRGGTRRLSRLRRRPSRRQRMRAGSIAQQRAGCRAGVDFRPLRSSRNRLWLILGFRRSGRESPALDWTRSVRQS